MHFNWGANLTIYVKLVLQKLRVQCVTMISLVLYSVHTISVTEKREDCRLGQIDRNSRFLTNFEDFKR